MRLSSNPRMPLLLVLSLMLLLTLLAALQYRATEQLVESQRTLQESTLNASIARLRGDVNGLFEQLSRHFEPASPLDLSSPDWLAKRLRDWREGEAWPDLINDVLVVTRDSSDLQLKQLDGDPNELRSQPWPDSLNGWHRFIDSTFNRLERLDDGSVRLELPNAPNLSDTPGVLVPVFTLQAGDLQPNLMFVLVTLRQDRIADSLLPELIAQEFEGLVADYVVQIISSTGRLLSSSDSTWESSADPAFAVPLLWASTRTFAAEGRGVSVTITDRNTEISDDRQSDRGIQDEDGLSFVNVYHRAGSLQAVLASAQSRQLGLVLGLLLLVAVVLVVLYVLAKRAQQLGEQQIGFVAGVSHELRTPIASMNALADNMMAGIVKTPEHAREYGELIREEGRRLQTMVEQVLDYATFEAGPRREAVSISLVSLLRSTIEREAFLLRGVHVEVNCDSRSEATSIMGDPDSLTVAFRNVLMNAVKHGPYGGSIRIRCHFVSTGRALIRIEIADEGPGIPAEERQRVFEPFFRGSRSREQQVPGNGLGLSLVRRIVESHGGTVRAEATHSGSANIVIELPRSQDTHE